MASSCRTWCKEATEEYFESEDVFGRWIEEECECGPAHKSAASELYASWREYAVARGEAPGSSKTFSELLLQRSFQRHKSGKSKYVGIAVKARVDAKIQRRP